MLPWVMRHRDTQREAGVHGAREFLDCGACRMSRHLRSRHRCGFIPIAEHATTPPEYAKPTGWPFARDDWPDVCPGYLIQLPQVLEVAQAHWWRETPQLAARFGGRVTQYVLDGVELMATEAAEVMAYEIAKARSK